MAEHLAGYQIVSMEVGLSSCPTLDPDQVPIRKCLCSSEVEKAMCAGYTPARILRRLLLRSGQMGVRSTRCVRGCCISFQGWVSSSARGPINHVQLHRPLSFARMATTSGWTLDINASSGHVGPLEQTRHRILVIHATWTRGQVQSIAHLDVQQSFPLRSTACVNSTGLHEDCLSSNHSKARRPQRRWPHRQGRSLASPLAIRL